MAPTPEARTPAAEKGTAFLYALMEQARQYPDTIVLGRGDPDLDTPAHIVAAARAAFAARPPADLPHAGMPELRQAIARRMLDCNGVHVDPETEVVVTNGGQEAVFLMVNALLRPGDEIVTPVPCYNTYENAIAFAGGVKVDVPSYAEEAFEMDPARTRAALTPRTRTLILNSPNNPSASVISPANVRALVDIAVEHDLTILADEIYDRFLYDGAQHLSPASLPGGRERTLTINGVSKAYSMTGWRLGWVVGPAPLMARVARLRRGVSGPVGYVTQQAALAALTGPQDCVAEAHQVYTRRRRIILDQLDALGLTYGLPKGGQFVFAEIRATGLDCWAFVRRVLEKAHVLVYPGASFGEAWTGFVRITFLQPEALIREAMGRIAAALKDL